jgi:hypothetical protein
MGRSVVDATNACRIRRTRGDSGRFRRLAVVERVEPVPAFALCEDVVLPLTFLVAALFLLPNFADGFGDFVLSDLLWLG